MPILFTVEANPGQSPVSAPGVNDKPTPTWLGSWPGDATAYVVPVLVGAAGVLQLGATLADGPARTQLLASANAAIERVLDDYCVPPLRLAIWPWPGPPPWVYEIASELTLLAFGEQGAMRDALLGIAAQVVGAATPPSGSR